MNALEIYALNETWRCSAFALRDLTSLAVMKDNAAVIRRRALTQATDAFNAAARFTAFSQSAGRYAAHVNNVL
jgi:hypothetical protein